MPRKSFYERDGWDEKLELIEGWARDGLTDEQIAEKMGIGVTTLYDYKKKYPEFLKSIKNGKEIIDCQVEKVLLKRALGYDYEETKVTMTDKGSKSKRIERTTKHAQPDTTAQIFWLKNRKPDEWRDKKDIELDINELPDINLVRGDSGGD